MNRYFVPLILLALVSVALTACERHVSPLAEAGKKGEFERSRFFEGNKNPEQVNRVPALTNESASETAGK